MKKLLKYYKVHIPSILLIFVSVYIHTMADLALPDYMSRIVNEGIINGNTTYIYIVGAQMILISFVGVLAFVATGYFSARVAAFAVSSMRLDVFKKVESFSNAEFDKFSTASLITRSTNDMQIVQMFTVMLFRMMLSAPIMAIGGIIKAVDKSPSMTWIIALSAAVLIGLLSIIFAITMPKMKLTQKLVDKLNLVMRERLTGLLVVRAFVNQDKEQQRFENANLDLTKLNLTVNRVMSLMSPFIMLVMNLTGLLVVYVGAKAVDLGTMDIGSVMAFMQYTMQIIMSFLMVSMLFIMAPRALVAMSRISEVLETEVSIKDSEIPKQYNESKDGEVEFKNVSFKYPDAQEYVLQNISFTANKGETVAIIGSTGSGKSTLINLIPRFYDATEGEVLVAGTDVKELSQKQLRDKIGYVPQKGVLFSGTIESNIKFASDSITDSMMEKSAKIAQSDGFILDKEDGYQSEVAQGGTNVSGGQKQRLSIARALAKDATIYIFDDSFSALDFKTDASLRKAIKENLEDVTVIIVAQRINTIRNADKIIVLDDGNMVGIGTHDQLSQNCAVYREIALSQLSESEI